MRFRGGYNYLYDLFRLYGALEDRAESIVKWLKVHSETMFKVHILPIRYYKDSFLDAQECTVSDVLSS